MFKKLSLLSLIIANSTLAAPQSLGLVHVSRSIEGSAPPVRSVYRCVNQLEGHTFSQASVDRCIKEILDTGYFLHGSATVRPGPDESGSVTVGLVLQAPQLMLKSLEFTLPESLKPKLEAFLERNPNVLHVGNLYDAYNEATTVSALEFFLMENGYRAAISSRLDLNYQDRTARLTYKVFSIPTRSRNFMRLPSQIDCDDVITDVNTTNIDDYVPLPLLDQYIVVRPTDCFSAEAIRQSQDLLEKTGLFTHVAYTISGEAGSRSVSLVARGKELSAENITLEEFGSGIALKLVDKRDLPLQTGEPFRQSLMMKSANLIATTIAKLGELAWVVPDVRLSVHGQVDVCFEIVEFAAEELYVNGTKVPADDISRKTQFTF